MNEGIYSPLVSIVVPVYNVEDYLRQCVDSILLQTYTNLQIILVNDGSTDNSLKILESYLYDKRVKIINKDNGGLSSARNAGTIIANGKYIVFLDSDDWLNIETIELAVQIAESKNVQLVFWQMIKEYEKMSIYHKGYFEQDRYFCGQDFNSLYRRIAGPIGVEMKSPNLIDSYVSAWGKLYLLDPIKQNKLVFMDTKVFGSEDILFNFNYFGKINTAYYLNRHLIHYRKDNPKSLTKNHGSTLANRYINMFDYLRNEIESLNLDSEFKIGYFNRVVISAMNVGLSEISPRNSISTFKKIRNLNIYLNSVIYRNSITIFNFSYLKIHWVIFFRLCKIRSGFGVFIMLKIMRLFIRK
jgi:glycosyltransferase involved in cell wall biosynthesis